MPSVINTNLASLFAQNSLSSAQSNLATSVQRLSSGIRINSSKDDATGLAISKSMQGKLSAIGMAQQNAQQATNLLQTADSVVGTVQDILLRMKQLAVEGANDSISTTQKLNVRTELNVLNGQINNIANGTTYNGISLLNTAGTSLSFQVGSTTATADQFSVSTIDVTTGTGSGSTAMKAVGGFIADGTAVGSSLAVLSASSANAAFNTAFASLTTSLDTAIETLSSQRATLGSQMNALSYVNTNLLGQQANLSASKSTILDTNFADETATLTKGQIMQQAATAMLAQANQMPNVILSLLK
jgi:flagellin